MYVRAFMRCFCFGLGGKLLLQTHWLTHHNTRYLLLLLFNTISTMLYTVKVDNSQQQQHTSSSHTSRSLYSRAMDKLRSVFSINKKCNEDYYYSQDNKSDCSMSSLDEMLGGNMSSTDLQSMSYQEEVAFSEAMFASPKKYTTTDDSFGDLVEELAVLDDVARLVNEPDNIEPLAVETSVVGKEGAGRVD